MNAELMRQHQAKKERAARFAQSAYKAPCIVVAPPAPVEPPVVEPHPVSDWIERQKAIPLPARKIELETCVPAWPPVDKIQKAVARHFGISRMDIMSERKMARIVLPRHIAVFLSKELTPLSLPQIGHRFGGKDHTTILHAVRRIEQKIAADPKIANIVAELRSQVAA